MISWPMSTSSCKLASPPGLRSSARHCGAIAGSCSPSRTPRSIGPPVVIRILKTGATAHSVPSTDAPHPPGAPGQDQVGSRPDPRPCPRRDEQRHRRTDHFDSERAEHRRSEEHTSELKSLMRISYAVFCLKKKKNKL